MLASRARFRLPLQAFAGMVLLACGTLLSGCADMSDGMTSAFADPAKYNLYDCKQLETERKGLSVRMPEMQGLMRKAQHGFAKRAEGRAGAPAAAAKSGPWQKSGNAVY